MSSVPRQVSATKILSSGICTISIKYNRFVCQPQCESDSYFSIVLMPGGIQSIHSGPVLRRNIFAVHQHSSVWEVCVCVRDVSYKLKTAAFICVSVDEKLSILLNKLHHITWL